MASSNDELLYDLTPLLKHYKDGRIERLLGLDTVPPSFDQETNVQSKDVIISSEINLSARLYRPVTTTNNPTNDDSNNNNPKKKLPLVVFFHGGAFVIESAFSPTYQNHLNHLVSQTQVVALSVNYRLAPEHPLPAAYEDSWTALKWIASSDRDDWIEEYADLDRVYLAGDSAGGNIAHNIAMRFGSEKLDVINVMGVFLNCPYFAGEDTIGNEEKHVLFPKSLTNKLWRYAFPEAVDCDDPRINPGNDTKISSLGCKKVLVYVGEKDVLRERGWYYKEVLEKSEWNGEVEVVEAEGEDHVFSVFVPTGENAKAMFKKVASFVNGH